MKPGFDHGSVIITKKFNEEEKHKEFCFKKVMWVVSLHYKKRAMFVLHVHICISSVYAFSCGYLHVYT